MSFAGVTSFIVAMNDIVFCPTCTRPAFVEDRFHLDSTDGLVVLGKSPRSRSSVQGRGRNSSRSANDRFRPLA